MFAFLDTVEPRRNFSQSLTESRVYQPGEELCVNIGDTATLQCCVSEIDKGLILWYKQPNKKQPQIMSRVETAKEIFYNQFQNLRFQLNRYSNCFNMIVSNIIQSDEAMYYCALNSPYTVFGNGTYLKVKGRISTEIDYSPSLTKQYFP